MEYQRLYPWELVPAFTKKAENNPTDTVSDTRKAINARLKEGETFDDVFASFDAEPLGAASVAQVPRA